MTVWKELSQDTAWLDGRDIILLAYDMEVQARFCPGEWSEDTPNAPAEYDGAVWSCFDDKFQIEIEETSRDPAEWFHEQATHWRELTPRPTTEQPAAVCTAAPQCNQSPQARQDMRATRAVRRAQKGESHD